MKKTETVRRNRKRGKRIALGEKDATLETKQERRERVGCNTTLFFLGVCFIKVTFYLAAREAICSPEKNGMASIALSQAKSQEQKSKQALPGKPAILIS